MRPLVFQIQERGTGWYVIGVSPLGPFPTEARAMELATGMAAELNRRGVPTEIRRLAPPNAHPDTAVTPKAARWWDRSLKPLAPNKLHEPDVS